MESPVDKRIFFAEEAACLGRVRNRFGASPDEKLCTIMPVLFPKLFERLENYRIMVIVDVDGDNNDKRTLQESMSSMKTAQDHIYGILASGAERLRSNHTIPLDSLSRAILPFIDSENNIVATWASALLQISMQRVSGTSMQLVSEFIAVLLQCLGKLHKKVMQSVEDEVLEGSIGNRWLRTSWLLLESLVLKSGRKPLADWNIDAFNAKFTSLQMGSLENNVKLGNNVSFPPPATLEEHMETRDGDCKASRVGYFYLALDLLLFWPGKSMLPNGDSQWPLSVAGQRRMEYKRTANPDGRQGDWSDPCKTYLRYLKAIALEFAIWPPGTGLLRGRDDDRSLLLSALVAGYDSDHGRVAMAYLDRWKTESGKISFPVATSILILVVGDEQARDLLNTFEDEHGGRFWEEVLGSTKEEKNESIRRPAMPWSACQNASDFLMEHFTAFENNTTSSGNQSNSNVEKQVILLIGLSLKISEIRCDEHMFLSIRLASFFFKFIQHPGVKLVVKLFSAIKRVLGLLVNLSVHEEDRIIARGDNATPLGVPAPFGNRNDLNQLLRNHRQDLKQRAMKNDNALRAREAAYKLILRLSPYYFQKPDGSPFELPNLLLQCAVYEHRYLTDYVVEALKLNLAQYKRKLEKDQSFFLEGDVRFGKSLRQQATLILPPLLEAVCSGVTHARMSATQWIEDLLLNMDSEAASYLASLLLRDENRDIAQRAQMILDRTSVKQNSGKPHRTPSCISFIDVKNGNGYTEIQKDLQDRLTRLAERLNFLSHEECLVLLLHNNFSIGRSQTDYQTKKSLDSYGILDIKCTRESESTDTDGFCGICYDDIDLKTSYSLSCGHEFCTSCWFAYITDRAKNSREMDFLDLRCPQHECTVRVMIDDMKRFDSSLVSTWNQGLLERYIEQDASYRFCPGPDCGCVAKTLIELTSAPTTSRTVTCDSCSTSFCFDCGESSHAPASCYDITQWNTLVKGSSQFWIRKHAKPCPGCSIPIEKNTGCNHMHCTKCNTDFCWLCLAVLNEHLEPHVCNMYDPSNATDDDFERRALRTTARYDAHDFAAKYAMDQLENFDHDKFTETYWFLNEDEDPDIMARALTTLVDGRVFLKHSYIKLLFMSDRNARALHEDHHSCLEMFTERLSRLTELNLHSEYTTQGQLGIGLHFRRLSFFTMAVAKYVARIEDQLL